MKIFSNKNKLIKVIKNEKSLGFVPTMGGIHLGHISLIKKSRSQCKKTIVSIYVNKPQFNNKDDFRNYPRELKKDIKLLKKSKVDYLFTPPDKEVYSTDQNKNIKISSLSKKLCGRFRPNHFKAVVDVVERFIKIIKPSKIYLGKKDMQQLKILESFIYNNYRNIKVVPCNTIRENNGIPYSSRNFLLSAREKKIASYIYKLVKLKKKYLLKKKYNINELKKRILKLGVKKIDYIEKLDIDKLIKPNKKSKKINIFIAYYIKSIRLIDNI